MWRTKIFLPRPLSCARTFFKCLVYSFAISLNHSSTEYICIQWGNHNEVCKWTCTCVNTARVKVIFKSGDCSLETFPIWSEDIFPSNLCFGLWTVCRSVDSWTVGCSWIRTCNVKRTSNSLKREKLNLTDFLMYGTLISKALYISIWSVFVKVHQFWNTHTYTHWFKNSTLKV